MSKSAKVDALLESAIEHFARDGYEGASLRDIANDVGMPLSSINRCFGSKAELFHVVLQKIWSEVETDRDLILKQAHARNSGPPQLSDLIEALARPIAQRALSKNKGDVARTCLLRMLRNEPPDAQHRQSVDLLESSKIVQSLGRWIDAIALMCPDLSRQDAVWVFSYVSGLIFSRQLIHHQYYSLFNPEKEPTVEDVTADIIAFGCAGIEALVGRRKIVPTLPGNLQRSAEPSAMGSLPLTAENGNRRSFPARQTSRRRIGAT
jgi:AcrR family transcriptional regulator